MQADVQPASWPRGESEMAVRIRAFDWAATPLGPISRWPRALRTLVDLMLASPQPAYLAWGPDHTSLYNDGYIPIAGTKHPRALGQPYREMWAEIWDDYRPLVAATMAGEAHLFTDRPVPLTGRPDRPMSWFTFSWTPVRDDEDRIAGFYCVALETTEAVLAHERVRESEERQALLLELSDALRDLQSQDEIGEVCCHTLAEAMDLDRVYFVRFLPQVNQALVGPEYVRTGLPPVSGTYPYSAFPEAIKQIEVETPVYDDVAADRTLPAAERRALLDLGFGAWIGVPIRTTTKQVDWALYVVSSRPRRWTTNEIALVKEAAERTWYAVERARAGQALRASEERQAFLLKLSDALRAEPDGRAMADTALRLLADHLGLDRAYFTIVHTAEDWVEVAGQYRRSDLAPVPPTLRPSDFPDGFRQVEESGLVVNDVDTEPTLSDLDRQSLRAIDLIAFIVASVRKGERNLVWALVAGSAVPRNWTPTETTLVRETAERIWSEMERARADRALRASEERFRGLVSASNQVLYRHNADWSEMVQLTGGGFLADTDSPDPNWFNAYIHPDDQPHVWAVIQEAIRTKSLFELEHRVVRADGTLGWALSRSTPLLDENGEIIEWFGAASDVTARRETEARLKRAAEADAFRVAFADALRPLSDPREIQEVATRALGERLGASRVLYIDVDEATGRYRVEHEYHAASLRSVKGPYRFEPASAPLFAALRAGQTAVVSDIQTDAATSAEKKAAYTSIGTAAFVDVPLVKEGQLISLLSAQSATPRDWGTGEIAQVMETAERTWAAVARARSEQALRASEERYRTLFETIDEGFVAGEGIRDEQGEMIDYRILEINPAFAKLNGRPAAEIVGKTVREIAPEVDAIWLETIGRVIADRRPIRLEHVVEGSGHWYDCYFAPAGEDEPERFVAVFTDITERKRAEIEREQAREQAEAAVRARDEFLSIASHELRNPIAAIKATAQLMQRLHDRGRLDAARLERYIQTVNETSERLAALVDDLLDVSRLETGRFPLHLETLDLATLVRRAIGAVEIGRPGIGRHRFRLNVDNGRVMRLDPERMQQVVVNLLDNAIKYSPEGGEVRILLTDDATGALVRVQDEGIGLPRDSLESIFEPFGRAANATSSQIRGMGLGLYIARRIVRAHGGRLWAESDGEGHGTTMCLWLPGMAGEHGDSATSRAGGR